MSAPGDASGHLRRLDGIRGAAALFVLIHHALLQSGVDVGALAGAAKLVVQPWLYGRYAVDVFIVLSGYCLMRPVVRPVVRAGGVLEGGVVKFWMRRARRVLPPYYLAMLMSLVLIWTIIGRPTGTHWDLSLPVDAASILSHAVMLHDAVGENYTINGVFWSIAVEWRIYLLFPLLVLLWRRSGTAATVLGVAASSIALSLLLAPWIEEALGAHFLALFALGMAAAAFEPRGDAPWSRMRRRRWTALAAATAASVAIFSVAKIWDGRAIPLLARELLVGAATASALVGLSADPRGWLSRVLGWRPLAWTGTFAYSIYLIHAPLLQVLWQYAFTRLQERPLAMFAALVGVGAPAIVAASYLFFLGCERPFLVRRRSRPQPAPTSLSPAGMLTPAASGVARGR